MPKLGVNLFSLISAEMQGYSICAENGQIHLTRNCVIAAIGVRQRKSLYKTMMRVVNPDDTSKVYLAFGVSTVWKVIAKKIKKGEVFLIHSVYMPAHYYSYKKSDKSTRRTQTSAKADPDDFQNSAEIFL